MTPKEIILQLRSEGIELARDGESLKLRATKEKVSDEQKLLVVSNKAALLSHLKSEANERDRISSTPGAADFANATSDQSEGSEKPGFYKEYVLANGEKLQLTKEEFDRVVDVVRLLLHQDEKVEKKKIVAS